jgi:hypothetical protein
VSDSPESDKFKKYYYILYHDSKFMAENANTYFHNFLNPLREREREREKEREAFALFNYLALLGSFLLHLLQTPSRLVAYLGYISLSLLHVGLFLSAKTPPPPKSSNFQLCN